jgi:KRAB domain-containing zinc finger protein
MLCEGLKSNDHDILYKNYILTLPGIHAFSFCLIAASLSEADKRLNITTKNHEHLEKLLEKKEQKSRKPNETSFRCRFICTVCGKVFNELRGLLKHQPIHKGEQFECKKCEMYFSEFDQFVDHKQMDCQSQLKFNVENELTSETNKQSEKLTAEKRVQKSTEPEEDIMPRFMCTICRSIFGDMGALVTHQQIHEGVHLSKCRECGGYYSQTDQLANHEQINCRCRKPPGCKAGKLQTPEQSETGAVLVDKNKSQVQFMCRFLCTICRSVFKDPGALVAHQQLHIGNKLFECKRCQHFFSRKDQLTIHEQLHHEKPCKCAICGLAFAAKQDLESHIQIHTTAIPCGDEKPCDENCGLVKHPWNYTVKKTYSCKICDKFFTRRHVLRLHERIHTGEKPFQCEFCGLTFHVKSGLRSHNVMHAGETKFECKTCGKTFLRKQSFISHITLHKGEKPFKCDTCGMAFPLKAYLNNHLQLHVNKKVFKCEYCNRTIRLKDGHRTHKCAKSCA